MKIVNRLTNIVDSHNDTIGLIRYLIDMGIVEDFGDLIEVGLDVSNVKEVPRTHLLPLAVQFDINIKDTTYKIESVKCFYTEDLNHRICSKDFSVPEAK